jgi:hypothetical protein
MSWWCHKYVIQYPQWNHVSWVLVVEHLDKVLERQDFHWIGTPDEGRKAIILPRVSGSDQYFWKNHKNFRCDSIHQGLPAKIGMELREDLILEYLFGSSLWERHYIKNTGSLHVVVWQPGRVMLRFGEEVSSSLGLEAQAPIERLHKATQSHPGGFKACASRWLWLLGGFSGGFHIVVPCPSLFPRKSVCPLSCAKTLHETRLCFIEILKAILGEWNGGFSNIDESSEERVNIWWISDAQGPNSSW